MSTACGSPHLQNTDSGASWGFLKLQLTFISDSPAMRDIFLEESQQPPDRILVILVLLALDDGFIAAENVLVSPLLGEVFVTQEILGPINVVVDFILMFLGNLVRDMILMQRV